MAEIPADLRLASLAARLRAQEIVLQCLCKVIATLDPRSSHAVAVALEVAELEQAEITGEDDEVCGCCAGSASSSRSHDSIATARDEPKPELGSVGIDHAILPRETGEGDRRRRWRGQARAPARGIAPSTMLRMVPLPRCAGED